ncbi:MAG: integrin [Verrucomicrobiales bacterium]
MRYSTWIAQALLLIVAGMPWDLSAQAHITQQAYLKAHNAPNARNFGNSVAASGDTVVVGASREPGNQSYEGAAYVFVRNGTSWTQQAQLKASNRGQDGFSIVAISGDTIVVGAPEEDSNAAGVNGNQADNSMDDAGAAYVFVRQGTTWTQQAYLKASNPGVDNFFGSSVAVEGETIVVGAAGEDSNATGVNGNQANNSAAWAGAAYVFVRNGTTWTQQAYLKASNTTVDDLFGSVAISGDTIVVGAQTEDSDAFGSGAAYVFFREGTLWTQQAYLKASNPGTRLPGEYGGLDGDSFGVAAAISGDTIVVGAIGEDSGATGINGDQTNNTRFNSGAAYIFVREGANWSQQAYLKASANAPNDAFGTQFGADVAVSGDTVVIGGPFENGGATGVNGNEGNQAARGAGAVWVFGRSGAAWNQRAYLKASNTGIVNAFGISVALSGDTLVVGAHKEDSSTSGVNSTPNNNQFSEYGAAYVFTGMLLPPPALAIQALHGNVHLSWPLSATDWLLEHSETMASPAAWAPIPAPYESDATGFFHTVPVPAGSGFFRLVRP